MYQLQFKNPVEVRMGSPFNVAEVDLTGGFVPSFEGANFQDKGVLNAERDVCFLVEWKIFEGGKPGFRVWRISEYDRSVKKSKTFEGCCKDISLNPAGIELIIFRNAKTEKVIQRLAFR